MGGDGEASLQLQNNVIVWYRRRSIKVPLCWESRKAIESSFCEACTLDQTIAVRASPTARTFPYPIYLASFLCVVKVTCVMDSE